MYNKYNEKLNTYLECDRNIVGVKILYSMDEFNSCNAVEVSKKAQYCVMVKSATLGHSIKVHKKNFKCSASARALGMIEPSDSYLSGKDYYEMGLYESENKSRKFIQKLDLNSKKAIGVCIKPLKDFKKDPDVVIIITNSYNAMRIIQANTYFNGIKSNFKLSGNQAICAECTSTPIIKNQINISFMCAGTRYAAKWDENEIGVGIPFSLLDCIIKGLEKTANKIETDEKKKYIKSKLESKGLDSSFITYGAGYFLE